jgi:GH25 family lysozyme M1 (1,4-beta-N-acetylmuramidase)
MKKIIILLIALICLLTTVSCSNSTENKPSVSTPKVTEPASTAPKKALEGIDVSSFNGKINWKKVKADKIDFAIIRIGGRGYGESGSIYQDEYALYNLKQAQKYGIKTGAYFFSQATSDKEAKEEAKYIAKTLGGIKITLPIGYDVERIKNDTSRIDNVNYNDSVRYAKIFMKTVKKLGYEPMVYIGEDSILKAKDFSNSYIWYADYKGDTENNPYKICQYSKEGKISGINGNVDLNRMYN